VKYLAVVPLARDAACFHITTTRAQMRGMLGEIGVKMHTNNTNNDNQRESTFHPKLLPNECKERDNFPT
jgi:hypothetical protein